MISGLHVGLCRGLKNLLPFFSENPSRRGDRRRDDELPLGDPDEGNSGGNGDSDQEGYWLLERLPTVEVEGFMDDVEELPERWRIGLRDELEGVDSVDDQEMLCVAQLLSLRTRTV